MGGFSGEDAAFFTSPTRYRTLPRSKSGLRAGTFFFGEKGVHIENELPRFSAEPRQSKSGNHSFLSAPHRRRMGRRHCRRTGSRLLGPRPAGLPRDEARAWGGTEHELLGGWLCQRWILPVSFPGRKCFDCTIACALTHSGRSPRPHRRRCSHGPSRL